MQKRRDISRRFFLCKRPPPHLRRVPDSSFLNPIKPTFKPALNVLAPEMAGGGLRVRPAAVRACSGFIVADE
jgi:hypothetical protein